MEIINSVGRGRPKLLTDELKRAITTYHFKNPEWSAQKIMDKIHYDLFKLWKDKYPKLTDTEIETKIRLPQLNRFQKYIQTLKPEQSSCLEQPWHVGLMREKKYHIPAQSLPFVLKAQTYSQVYKDEIGNPYPVFTIRQALWVSRLFGIIAPDAVSKKNDPKMVVSIGRYLYLWANAYATRERICDLSDTPFDTSNLDRLLISRGEPLTKGKTTLVYYRKTKSFEIDTIDDEMKKMLE